MQPFQMILKSSRSLAAECLALIMNFVCRDKAEVRMFTATERSSFPYLHLFLHSESETI